MKKIFLLMMALVMLLTAACANQNSQMTTTTTAVSENKAAAGQELVVKVLNIGQGDAILIKAPSETILFDTGDVDQREELVKLLKRENVSAIDKLIISHPHADHLGGAYAVFKNFKVKAVYDNGQPTTTKTYQTYLKQIKQNNIEYRSLKAGDKLDFGSGIILEIFNPTAAEVKQGGELNNNSLVGRLAYNGFTMLLTGDCEADREKELLKNYADKLKSDVLKSPHHGSKTSSNRKFLQAVNPKDVIISCGVNNDYGHPHKETMNKYNGMKLNIYRTDKDGTVTVTTDGKTYAVTKENEK